MIHFSANVAIIFLYYYIKKNKKNKKIMGVAQPPLWGQTGAEPPPWRNHPHLAWGWPDATCGLKGWLGHPKNFFIFILKKKKKKKKIL